MAPPELKPHLVDTSPDLADPVSFDLNCASVAFVLRCWTTAGRRAGPCRLSVVLPLPYRLHHRLRGCHPWD